MAFSYEVLPWRSTMPKSKQRLDENRFSAVAYSVDTFTGQRKSAALKSDRFSPPQSFPLFVLIMESIHQTLPCYTDSTQTRKSQLNPCSFPATKNYNDIVTIWVYFYVININTPRLLLLLCVINNIFRFVTLHAFLRETGGSEWSPVETRVLCTMLLLRWPWRHSFISSSMSILFKICITKNLYWWITSLRSHRSQGHWKRLFTKQLL